MKNLNLILLINLHLMNCVFSIEKHNVDGAPMELTITQNLIKDRNNIFAAKNSVLGKRNFTECNQEEDLDNINDVNTLFDKQNITKLCACNKMHELEEFQSYYEQKLQKIKKILMNFDKKMFFESEYIEQDILNWRETNRISVKLEDFLAHLRLNFLMFSFSIYPIYIFELILKYKSLERKVLFLKQKADMENMQKQTNMILQKSQYDCTKIVKREQEDAPYFLQINDVLPHGINYLKNTNILEEVKNLCKLLFLIKIQESEILIKNMITSIEEKKSCKDKVKFLRNKKKEKKQDYLRRYQILTDNKGVNSNSYKNFIFILDYKYWNELINLLKDKEKSKLINYNMLCKYKHQFIGGILSFSFDEEYVKDAIDIKKQILMKYYNEKAYEKFDFDTMPDILTTMIARQENVNEFFSTKQSLLTKKKIIPTIVQLEKQKADLCEKWPFIFHNENEKTK